MSQTLASFSQIHVPKGLSVELLVVDNASTDHTKDVVLSCGLSNMTVRHLFEPKQGKCYALNAGMAVTQGDIILFTDDDVRVPTNWIEAMCAPLLSSQATAVVGGIKIPPHLERPWMMPVHRAWLAATQHLDRESPNFMVGANMGFLRSVLNQVPQFDTELGPGALGMGEDGLFTMQIQQAGHHIKSVFDVEIEHHFEQSRLTHESWISRTQKEGRITAYVLYHWSYSRLRLPWLRLIIRSLQLHFLRIVKRREYQQKEGIPIWELNLITEIYCCKQYLIERERPRNYERHGLIKLLNN